MTTPTPLEFMERALPWPGPEGSGWGNLHWSLIKPGRDGKPTKQWRGAAFKTAEALIAEAQKLTMAPAHKCEDLFFCTSIQSTTETITMPDGRSFTVASRHADTACAIKALFLDIDVKAPPKGYLTKAEAWGAVQKFLTDARLPQPSALVWSGGGMHVYWFSNKTLTVPEWAPFAQGLKAEAMRLGLRADYGVTTDPARILRVPGTFNRKIAGQPRAVKVAALGDDYDFAVDLAHLKLIGAPLVTAPVTKPAPFDMSAFQGYVVDPALAASLASATDKLSDGIKSHSDLPLDPANVIRECPHFQDAAVNRGKGQGQGLWNLTVLASTWFEDGPTWAKRFSDKYPTFDKNELDALYDRKLGERAKGLGWPSCKAFEDQGCTHCAGCQYKPLGKSPLNLAERVKPPEPDPANQVVTNPVTQVVLTEADLRLPHGFCLWHGQICRKVNTEEDPKKPPTYDYVPVFMGEVISKPQISAHRPPTLYFKYQQGPNYMEVIIPYTAYASDQALASAFLEVGILTNPAADKFVRTFMRSWVGRIDLAVKRLTTEPLGWVIENGVRSGFAYGGRLFLENGTEIDSGLAGEWFQKYVPSGEEAPIHKALEILSERHVPALEIAALQAWASPLVEISGLKSTAIMWLYSFLGGRGKSFSLRTGTALWGAPDKCRMRGGATFVGLENTFDRLRNLPAQVDELTDETAIDKIAGIFQNIGEGGQGAKGTRGGGVRDDKFWQLNLTCGSNTSLRQYQARKGQDTNAKATRVFEIKVESTDSFKRSMTEVDQLVGSLEYNYGHLGLRYAKYLAMNHRAIDARYQVLDKQVIKDLTPEGAPGIGNEERFWKTSVTLTLLAAELANEITGKPYFHIAEIKQFLYDTYHEHRSWVRRHVLTSGTGMHTEEAWNRLLNSWINDQLVTKAMGGNKAGRSVVAAIPMPTVQPDYARGHTTKIHWLAEPPMIRIAYSAFVETLEELKLGTAMADTLQDLYGGKVERKVYLAGIPVQQAKNRIKVWEIPMTPGHMLYRTWADRVQVAIPADALSEALVEQDAEPPVRREVTPAPEPTEKGAVSSALASGMAQAAKDLSTVRSST